MYSSTLYKLYLNCDLNCYLLGDNLSGNSSKLYEILNLFQLHQVIKEPTRVTNNHESIIDIRASNRPEKTIEFWCITL